MSRETDGKREGELYTRWDLGETIIIISYLIGVVQF